MRIEPCTLLTRALVAVLLFLAVDPAALAQNPAPPEVPSNFTLDMQTAARLRPRLIEASVVATGRYVTGRLVFDRLVQQVRPASSARLGWQLRIVENDQLNAYSSPDGVVYVESGLAKVAGPSAGLWAAILSHEIAHVVRRDWARRYLYEKLLERDGGGTIVLGDPGLPSATWSDSEKASADMGRFCRQMELEADREGLALMAKAGYHPDFVPALHHLLHAHGVSASASLYAMHPCWEERDRELSRVYTEASIEFEHRWPEWYASPGGNPPVVVFADPPTVKKTSAKQWQIQVPMRCQNLAGAVEVVLRADTKRGETMRLGQLSDSEDGGYEVRQLTGCTSPRTTVVFTQAEIGDKQRPGTQWTDVYVIDSWGKVLARADLPKLPR
ncbi:MAG TPA: M48 family metalloprotease [Candidatus Dormibacteraeota bacterium]|nr:M48 family metalloprotease [Candidatus Dormibacteraeota bacterium]